MDARALLDTHRACEPHAMAASRHRLDTAQCAALEETDHRRGVVRWSVTESHFDRLAFAGLGVAAGTPQGARVQAVMRDESIVEAAYAGEAAGQRHLSHRQARIGDELLGSQQAPRLQILQRRHAELRLEDAPQVAVAHPQLRRDLCRAGAAVIVTVRPRIRLVDEARCLQREDARRIFGRPARGARCQFWPAAQAWAKPFGLGLRGMAKEAAVFAPRGAHPADRPAVDPGRCHCGKKRAIEACVVRLHGEVAGVVLQRRAVGW